MNETLFKKEKFVCPSAEDILPKTLYSFTISPHDGYQEKYRQFNARYATCKDNLERLLQKIEHVGGRMEISSNGRYHFHGWIWFLTYQEIREFFSRILRFQEECTYELSPIRGIRRWYNYCMKQQDLWEEYDMWIRKQDLIESRLWNDMRRHLEFTQDIVEDYCNNGI